MGSGRGCLFWGTVTFIGAGRVKVGRSRGSWDENFPHPVRTVGWGLGSPKITKRALLDKSVQSVLKIRFGFRLQKT